MSDLQKNLKVSYSIFKKIAQNHTGSMGWKIYQYEIEQDQRDLWTGNTNIIYSCNIDAEDIDDYENTFGSMSITASLKDDAIAQIIGLSGIKQHPESSDGKQIVLTSMFRGDISLAYTSVEDDIINGNRWGGDSLKLMWPSGSFGEKNIEFQFKEWIYIAGGMLHTMNGTMNDWFSYEVNAPATSGTQNINSGSYDKLSIGGGINMFIPNSTQNGDWDLDLTASLNENVNFTKVVPVPSSTETGFFDWDHTTETVTLNLSQTGKFNIFDSELHLSSHINKINAMGNHMHDLRTSNIKPKRILAHWKHKIIGYHYDDNSGNKMMLAAAILMARKSIAKS